jgi:hypothetical protein
MKQKSEASCSKQVKYARMTSTAPSFSLGRKREEEYKQKCAFVHYGFLIVEWMGAHGLPLSLIETMDEKLVGPDAEPGPILKRWRNKFAREEPTIYTCELSEGNREGDRVKVEERELSTWIPHALMTQFMSECDVRSLLRVVFALLLSSVLCCT